jgi:predicted transcriptional regulator of viral defense system
MADHEEVQRATGVPAALWHRPVRVLRPRDASDGYADPQKELARLVDRGLLRRLATGYFALVPTDRVGAVTEWMPPLEDAAWAIAAADYGVDGAALCGASAARHHGLLPRALAVAYVAVPKQRPLLALGEGQARYVKRDLAALDLERVRTQLGEGWVTTLEQTVLDLAARADGWRIEAGDLEHALRAAVPRCDADLVERLARRQRKRSAFERLTLMGLGRVAPTG